VLLQFGGPDSLEAVEPFLYNLFSDNDIVQVPFPSVLQKPLARRISKSRSKSVGEKYGEIGGKSPIVEKTYEQQQALQRELDSRYGKGAVPVLIAMRYWKPFTDEAVIQLQALKIKNVVLLPLYAQYSKVNAGSSYAEWERATKKLGAQFEERRIVSYHLHPLYIDAMRERLNAALTKFTDKKPYVLFSAHGIPIDLVFEGDLYPIHINETMEAIMEGRTDLEYGLSYQSKIGPKAWLEPSTDEKVEELAHAGVKDLLVVPIAFTSDHIETLHELDIELREEAEHEGITNFAVAEALNSSPKFIATLAELVEVELRSLAI
jgi:protoporphyrin/coproporphyrin ferrochelatase